MLRELTKENFSDSEPVQHLKFPFVYFSGKKYFCQEHPNLRMNGGTIKQHIRGPQHRLNFETAEPLSKQDDPFVNLPHKQKDFDIESFLNRKKILEFFFPEYPYWVKDILAKFELKGKFQDEVLKFLYRSAVLKDIDRMLKNR